MLERFGDEIEVMARGAADFSYLPALGTETRTLAARIPVLGANGGSLIVRVYNNKIAANSTGSIVVRVVDDVSTPQQTFLGSSAITGGSVAVGVSGPGAGAFERSPITGDLGSMVAVQIVGTQGATGGAALAVEVDVGLILRNGA